MTRVVVSDQNRTPLLTLKDASNIKWRKALNAIGYASFDLPLNDPYATPTYLHAGNFLHIYDDNTNSTNFSLARWGGLMTNDYEIKPKDGLVTVGAAGLAQMVELSIVNTTTLYNNMDLGSVVVDLLTTRDNAAAMPLTAFSVSSLGPQVTGYTAGYGDPTWDDITTLMSSYGCDTEIRPDFTYGFYIRQGIDRPGCVARYGALGNVALDSAMHLVNTEMGNQIVYTGLSGSSTYVADPSAAQYYGKRTLVIQDSAQYDPIDIQTRALEELAKRKDPLFVLDKVQLRDSSLCPFYLISIGDRINFQAPGLPFLSTFNGLQRILAMEYDDTKRTMDLTLGNAVYTVIKGKLHEVRLYT